MSQKKKVKDKKCKECGNTFTPFQPLQPVCSKSCEIKYKAKKKTSKSVSPPKRSSIAPMSKKAKAEHAIYMPIRNEYMKEHPVCECCNTSESVDLHHKAGRIGYWDEESRLKGLKLLWDKRFFMAVCRGCHNEIHHVDPKTAYEMGYLLKKK